MTSKVIATPINLDKPSTTNGVKARIDYLREHKTTVSFSNSGARWDDSRFNNAKIGDYFAFVHQSENRMEIFKIETIDSCDSRPIEWTIAEQADRNVLNLSEKQGEMKWNEFKLQNDYKASYILRGTSKLKFQV
jgi:hypothetical protein